MTVKSNEWCINLNTQQPASLAEHPLNTPKELKVISLPYYQQTTHNSQTYENKFVNVTDGINNYRVLEKAIIN